MTLQNHKKVRISISYVLPANKLRPQHGYSRVVIFPLTSTFPPRQGQPDEIIRQGAISLNSSVSRPRLAHSESPRTPQSRHEARFRRGPRKTSTTRQFGTTPRLQTPDSWQKSKSKMTRCCFVLLTGPESQVVMLRGVSCVTRMVGKAVRMNRELHFGKGFFSLGI
jgi:hypothetical protein